MKKFVFILLVLAFSLGYSAILKWPEDCEELTDGKIMCYHSVAISYAITGNVGGATQYCGMIRIGTADDDDDIVLEGQADRCFRDVAVIIASTIGESEGLAICERISTSDFSFGSERNLCRNEVEAEAREAPECTIMYILPLLVMGSFFFRSSIH